METRRSREARRRRQQLRRAIAVAAATVILGATGVWALSGDDPAALLGERGPAGAFTATTADPPTAEAATTTPPTTTAAPTTTTQPPTTTAAPTTTKPQPKVLFADDFDGLSGGRWAVHDHAADVNEELQYYTPDNVAVRDGTLVITGEQRAVGEREYASGMVTTAGRFAFTYGTVEWRAQVPVGKGVWPALWLLGADCAATFLNGSQLCPTWPTTGSDEVDVLEFRGSQPNTANFARHFNTEAGSSDPFECNWSGADLSAGWHTYGLRWTPEVLIWTVDGAERCRTATDVPTEPMFLLMNFAIGGVFDGDPTAATPFPQEYLIDWVRVTAPPGT